MTSVKFCLVFSDLEIPPTLPPRIESPWDGLVRPSESSSGESRGEFSLAVADLGFPRGWAPTPDECAQTYYFAIFFVENCMRMKEFGP